MRSILPFLLLAFTIPAFSQTIQDTTKLEEVIIRPYFTPQPLLRTTGAVGVIDPVTLGQQSGNSFVPAFNTVSGVRMEERSPGSYRLSIRGSLLRSPFGIRNIKLYFDGFPITDAGGNTYLNAIDLSGVKHIEVLKGPQSSIYGANSGGVVLIEPRVPINDKPSLAFNLTGGSFGLFQENLNLGNKWKKYTVNITQSYQKSNGYRNHSAMERKYLQLNQQWNYSSVASLSSLLFYSDLHYETPGGLTAVEYEQTPEASRPAAGNVRSAEAQKAGIYSKTFFAGVTDNWQFSPHFKHVFSVFTSHTDFKNPFLTNYEHRKELTFGVRTYVEYVENLKWLIWRFNLGLEASKTASSIINTENNDGNPAALQASDRINSATNFSFAHLNVDIFQRLNLELSTSANLYQYNYEHLGPIPGPKKNKSFDLQLMPRIALSYLALNNLSLRASLSRGYSPPTIAEVRASDNIINTTLQPERGWNYEAGVRYQTENRRFILDLTGFYYHLEDAIVRRLNDNSTEYFINAGGTKQWGLETSFSAWLIPANSSRTIRGLVVNNAYTLSHFKFAHYTSGSSDFSGKGLTGVPKNVVVTSIDLRLPKGLYIFLQHNYTAKTPLTDANTVYAKAYHLVQSKIGWNAIKITNFPIEIFAGVDNLLNQHYSLGNDLNAAGGRYFNAAATRNYYGGLIFRI